MRRVTITVPEGMRVRISGQGDVVGPAEIAVSETASIEIIEPGLPEIAPQMCVICHVEIAFTSGLCATCSRGGML